MQGSTPIDQFNTTYIRSKDEIQIEKDRILIKREELAPLTFEEVLAIDDNKLNRLSVISFFDKNKTHWAKFHISNELAEDAQFILDGGENSKETYHFISDSTVIIKKAGYLFPLADRDIQHNHLNEVSIDIPAHTTILVLVKIESLDNNELDIQFRLVPFNTWEKYLMRYNLLEGIFSGTLLVFAILSFFFYHRSKSPVFIHLSLYTVVNLIYFANIHGIIEIYIFRQTANAIPPLWLLPLLTSAAYIELGRSFNQTKEYYPKWDVFFKYVRYACIILFGILSIYLIITNDYKYSVMIMQGFLLALVAMGLVFLFTIFQSGRTIHKYFVYGSVILLFSVTVTVIELQLELRNSIPDFVQFGFFIEILIFSLGLSYKAQLEYEEHDITQRSLILQLQQNDKLKENINNKLREEVSERTQELRLKNIELSAAKETAEKATISKSEFLSVMSHEIRTPLNAIISLSHIMEIDNADKKITEYIDALKFSTESLHALINDVLDYNKIEANKLRLEHVEFSMIDTLRNISEIFKFKAKSKGIDLRIEIGEHTPDRLIGDPTRLTQIFNNLLSNAIKFTHEGHVTLKVYLGGIKDEKAIIHFDVIDTGIGIPADKIETIFKEFEQASNSTTREFGGTGLGLSITKKLLNLMGSDIRVEQTEEVGTKFSFEIGFVINKSFNIISHGDMHLERDLKGAKILVVDDNDMNRLVLKRLFTIWKSDFTEARDGHKALTLCAENEYDLVLMDIEMRPLDGFQTMAELHKTANKNLKTNFIAMSAYQTEEFDNDILGSGFKAFIHKPFDPDELYERVIQHLNSQNVEE